MVFCLFRISASVLDSLNILEVIRKTIWWLKSMGNCGFYYGNLYIMHICIGSTPLPRMHSSPPGLFSVGFLISFFCRSFARITSLRVAFQSSLLLLGKPKYTISFSEKGRCGKPLQRNDWWDVFCLVKWNLCVSHFVHSLPKTAGSPLLNRPFRPWSPKGPHLSCSNNGHTKELEKIQEKAAAKVPVVLRA